MEQKIKDMTQPYGSQQPEINKEQELVKLVRSRLPLEGNRSPFVFYPPALYR